MKRILLTMIAAAAVLTSADANAGDVMNQIQLYRDVRLDPKVARVLVASVHMHDQICDTEIPEVLKLLAIKFYLESGMDKPGNAAAAMNQVKAEVIKSGIGPWCRSVSKTFKKFEE